MINKITTNESNNNKKKALSCTAGASVGGALGYIIPVQDRIFEKPDSFDTKTLFKYNLDSNGLRVKKTPTSVSTFLIKKKNYPLKTLNAIIGAVVGLGAAYLIWGRKKDK